MVFGTEMLRLLVQTGYESFHIHWHLVGTAAKAMNLDTVVSDRGHVKDNHGVPCSRMLVLNV